MYVRQAQVDSPSILMYKLVLKLEKANAHIMAFLTSVPTEIFLKLFSSIKFTLGYSIFQSYRKPYFFELIHESILLHNRELI